MTSGSRAPTTTRCACHDMQMNLCNIHLACMQAAYSLAALASQEGGQQPNSLELLNGTCYNHVSAPSCAFWTLVYALLYKLFPLRRHLNANRGLGFAVCAGTMCMVAGSAMPS